jgi:hypothetical protein
MTKYRIRKIDNHFQVQQKSVLGFWFNPLNIDAYRTGYYDTIEEADDAIKQLNHKPDITIVREYQYD